jgi:hypothetical protein
MTRIGIPSGDRTLVGDLVAPQPAPTSGGAAVGFVDG